MDIISSILELPKQCKQAWDETSKLKLPRDGNIQNVVVCGMGGSALGAHIVQSIAVSKVPIIIVSDYSMPSWVSESTLCVLSSYSGNTEEILNCAGVAKDRGCKIVGITTGGKLAKWLEENSFPAYVFAPKYNSTGLPRLGVGYSLYGLMGILNTLGLFQGKFINSKGLEDVFNSLEMIKDKIREDAKDCAKKLKGKMPVIFAEGIFAGNAHVFANQLNESSKTFSTWFVIPEANHHLLEGLQHPKGDKSAVFLVNTKDERIGRRFDITVEILEKNGWEVLHYPNDFGGDEFLQTLVCLLFSSLVTVYLAAEYREDPLATPTVDYFKQMLEK